MSILSWIILGAVAGWIASILAGTNAQMGLLANIIVGVIGAFLGGLVFSLFGGEGITGFDLWSLLVAILGAFVLLLILKSIHRPHSV